MTTHVDHNQLDDPLPFKIIYTNIVALWLHRHSVILQPAQDCFHCFLTSPFLNSSCCKYFVCLFCCFCVYSLEVEDYIKCELIGGGHPSYLNTLKKFIIMMLYTIYISMYC